MSSQWRSLTAREGLVAWLLERADLRRAIDELACWGCEATHDAWATDPRSAALTPWVSCACDCHKEGEA